MRPTPPALPKALMARSRFEDPVFILVPETHIDWFRGFGWFLLAKDSDVPAVKRTTNVHLLSNPRRVPDPPPSNPEE